MITSFFNHFSVRRKLFVFFIFLGTVLILGVWVPSSFYLRQVLYKNAFETLDRLADVQLARTQKVLELEYERANLIVSRTQLRLSLASYLQIGDIASFLKIKKILADVIAVNRKLLDISILSLQGDVVYSTSDVLRDNNFSEAEYFIEGKGKNFIYVPKKAEKTDDKLYVSTPIILDGKLLGVLVVTIESESLFHITGDYTALGETGETLLVDKSNKASVRLIGHRRFLRTSEEVSRIFHSKKQYDEIELENSVVKLRMDYRQKKVVSVSRKLPRESWEMIVKMDQSEIMKPLTTLKRIFILVGIVSVIVLTLFAMVMAKVIGNPLLKLVDLVRDFGAGNLEVRLPSYTRDEVGVLTKGLNEMAEKLKYSTISVEKYREESNKRRILNEQLLAKKEEIEKLNKEYRDLALIDPLTGMNNRRGFSILMDQQAKLMRRKHGSGLLFAFDLDKMKEINDTYGHDQGDCALCDIADLLRGVFRSSDILARFGGDEYVVFAVDALEDMQDLISQRLSKAIHDFNAQKDRLYTLSLSWGAVFYDPSKTNETIESVLKRADEALYLMKKQKD